MLVSLGELGWVAVGRIESSRTLGVVEGRETGAGPACFPSGAGVACLGPFALAAGAVGVGGSTFSAFGSGCGIDAVFAGCFSLVLACRPVGGVG